MHLEIFSEQKKICDSGLASFFVSVGFLTVLSAQKENQQGQKTMNDYF